MTKPTTWDEPILEANACQFAKCRHCGGIVLYLEAQDGAFFASAHFDTAQGAMDWLIECLKDAAIKRGETVNAMGLKTEIEQLRADKDVIRSQERNAAYERDIAALEAEIDRLRAVLNNLDACAVPTAEQIEQMEKGIGAIYTPAMALRLGMETAIGNVKRAMAALEQKSP